MFTKNNLLYLFCFLLFIGGIVTETWMLTKYQLYYGMFGSPVVWLIGGAVTCISGYYLLHRQVESPKATSDNWIIRSLCVALVFIFGTYYSWGELADIFSRFEIHKDNSDIVPSLQLYVRRWLSGEKVYAPFDFGSWTVLPTYFPLLWMPYAFSELLNIDYRWTAFLVFLLSISFYNYKLIRSETPWWWSIIKAAFPFLLLNSYFIHQESVFGFAVELLPIGFYLLLTLTVFSRSKWAVAVGILLCLLSRYAFTFWLPVYLIILWIERGFKFPFQSGLMVLAGVALLYIFPFLSKDTSILTNGLKYYAKTAETQWQRQHWQPEGATPHHLSQGIGFAMYFYSKQDYTVQDRLSRNRKVHLLLTGITALLFFAGYFVVRKKGWNVKWYLIVGLKFYLLIFYGFFYVPFAYLYMLPLFLSIPLVYGVQPRLPSSIASKS